MFHRIGFLSIYCVLCTVVFPCLSASAETPTVTANATAPVTGPTAARAVLAVTPEDHVEGSPNAPVTVIEYFSLTCEHCAHFARTTLPAIRKAYIETGKVRWVYRDFPLDGQALQAAVLARCAGGSRYTALVQAMLDAQSGWVGKADYSKALVNIAKLAGVDADTIARCQEDKKAENMVLQMRTDANTQLQLRSTPTFFVNGAELKGAMDTEKFEGMIQGALAQIAPHS